MAQRTANNSLLRTPEGNELVFERLGSQITNLPNGTRFSGFNNGQEFAGDYGRTNPNEDIATTWEQYFTDYEGDHIVRSANIGPKLAVLDAYFASLV